MVIILPKMKTDLNKIKREDKLDEDNIRAIIKQLFNVITLVYSVRDLRHQDVKPENVLLDYEEEDDKITNIKVYSILFTLIIIYLFSD